MKFRLNTSRFASSEKGTVAILWAISLVAYFDAGSIDIRLWAPGCDPLELQSYADNVALAAAGELDGRADAITRANLAAANLISDTQTFGTGNNDGDAERRVDIFIAAPHILQQSPSQADLVTGWRL